MTWDDEYKNDDYAPIKCTMKCDFCTAIQVWLDDNVKFGSLEACEMGEGIHGWANIDIHVHEGGGSITEGPELLHICPECIYKRLGLHPPEKGGNSNELDD